MFVMKHKPSQQHMEPFFSCYVMIDFQERFTPQQMAVMAKGLALTVCVFSV